jgi:hypothetical protein
MVVRQNLPARQGLLLRCGVTSSLVAAAAAAFGVVFYGVSPSAATIVALAVFCGGYIRLASGVLQVEERFVASTLMSESMNYLLLGAAVIAVLAGVGSYLEPMLLVAVAQFALAATIRLRLLAAASAADGPAAKPRLSEMVLFTGTNAALLVLQVVERFAIPMFLDIEALAAFAVLAVFSIAPFRPIEFGIYRTLLPRLRRPASGAERRRMLVKEAIQTLWLTMLLGLALAVVTPLVLGYLFAQKFEFGMSAALAGIVGGQIRVARSMASAVIAALADRASLVWWNAAAWVSVGAAFMGGWIGSKWGLGGFLWGVALAGIGNFVLALSLLQRSLGHVREGR